MLTYQVSGRIRGAKSGSAIRHIAEIPAGELLCICKKDWAAALELLPLLPACTKYDRPVSSISISDEWQACVPA